MLASGEWLSLNTDCLMPENPIGKSKTHPMKMYSVSDAQLFELGFPHEWQHAGKLHFTFSFQLSPVAWEDHSYHFTNLKPF